jgi:hypothetical protein
MSDHIEYMFPLECRTRHKYTEVVPWCEQNIGVYGEDWFRYGSDIALGIVAGYDPDDIYRFRDQQAAVLFGLKWS